MDRCRGPDLASADAHRWHAMPDRVANDGLGGPRIKRRQARVFSENLATICRQGPISGIGCPPGTIERRRLT